VASCLVRFRHRCANFGTAATDRFVSVGGDSSADDTDDRGVMIVADLFGVVLLMLENECVWPKDAARAAIATSLMVGL